VDWLKSCLSWGFIWVGGFLLGSTLGVALLSLIIDRWTDRLNAEGKGDQAPGAGTLGILLLPVALVVGGVLSVLLTVFLRKHGLEAWVPYLAAVGWLVAVVGFIKLVG
jgi:hypothetical protein